MIVKAPGWSAWSQRRTRQVHLAETGNEKRARVQILLVIHADVKLITDFCSERKVGRFQAEDLTYFLRI